MVLEFEHQHCGLWNGPMSERDCPFAPRESHRRDRAAIDGRLGCFWTNERRAGEANGPLFL